MGKNNMLPRICRQCGKSFLGGPRAWYCPECRAERKLATDREFKARKRAGNVVPIGSIIKCEICGKDIVKNSGLQRFCDKCAEEHLKAVDNAQSLQWKRENMDKIREGKREISKRRHAEDEQLVSGVTGVSWEKGKRRWLARIYYCGKQYTIVRAKDKDIAVSARKEAEKLKLSGELTREKIEELKSKYKN